MRSAWSCLVLYTALTTLSLPSAQASRVGPMELKVGAGGRFALSYADVPVIVDGSYYLADAAWKSTFPQRTEWYKREVQRLDDRIVTTLVTKDDAPCYAEQRFTLTVSSLTWDVSYQVPANTDTAYAVLDVFLDKQLFDGNRFTAVTMDAAREKLAFEAATDLADTARQVERLRSITFENLVGKVGIDLATELLTGDIAAPSQWALRNVSDRTWGPEEQRTFTLLNLFKDVPPTGLNQKLSFALTVEPAPDLEDTLRARFARCAASALGEKLRRYAVEVEQPSDDASPEEMQSFVETASARLLERWNACGARGYYVEDAVIIPQPQEMRLTEGEFVVPQPLSLVVADDASGRDLTGPEALQTWLDDEFGIAAEIARVSAAPGSGLILIGEPGTNRLVSEACERLGLRVSAEDPGPEGYVLSATPQVVVVAGSDAAGSFYGVQSLIQLLGRNAAGEVVVPGVQIRDWPEFRSRGLHIHGMGGEASPEDLRRTITEVAARYKLNRLAYGGSYRGFVWTSRPELSSERAKMTMDDLGGIADLCRSNFLEFVPSFASYGHMQTLIEAFPEIGEVDAETSEVQKSYCPSKPETYELIFDLWQEVIDATHPTTFHIGHDEIQGIGTCELCRTKPHHQLFAEDVTKLHDWLAERGIRTMMWGDMLLDPAEFGDYGIGACNANNPYYGATDVQLALPQLPKDIIIADWHYRAVEEFPTPAHFMKHGLEVVGAPWYDAKNNFYFARSAHEQGALGMLVTDWGFLTTLSAAATSILGAEYAWTPNRPTLEELPYDPPRVLAAALRPRRPSEYHDAGFAPVDISGSFNGSYAAQGWDDDSAWFGRGLGEDLHLLPGGEHNLGGMWFWLSPAQRCLLLAAEDAGRPYPHAVTDLPLHTKAKSLLFLQAMSTARPSVWQRPRVKLTFHYDDDTTEVVELKENLHLTHWLTYEERENPWHWREGNADLYAARCAWRGYTLRGEDCHLQAFEWVNPHPEKRIPALDVELAARDVELQYALLAITAVN